MANGRFVPNAIYGNGGEPIDREIDGPSPQTTQGVPGQGGLMGTPVILTARWNGTETVIEGRTATSVGATHMYSRVYVYANGSVDAKGMAEAEELIGVVEPRSGPGFSSFVLRVPRDLRGMWVNAATYSMYVINWDDPAPGTSELGVPRQVE